MRANLVPDPTRSNGCRFDVVLPVVVGCEDARLVAGHSCSRRAQYILQVILQFCSRFELQHRSFGELNITAQVMRVANGVDVLQRCVPAARMQKIAVVEGIGALRQARCADFEWTSGVNHVGSDCSRARWCSDRCRPITRSDSPRRLRGWRAHCRRCCRSRASTSGSCRPRRRRRPGFRSGHPLRPACAGNRR